MSPRIKGFIFGCIAAATYGMNPLFALPLYAASLTVADVLLLRYVFALFILWIMIRWRGRNLRIARRQILPLFGLGLLMGFSSLLLFESYNYMEAGIASTILFVYPLMVALIMALVYHERLTPLTIGCIITASIGIAMLYRGDSGATLSLTGTVLVILSALSYAIYLVWVNSPSLKRIPTLVLTFYVILFGSLIFIVQQIFGTGRFTMPPSPLLWGCALALGLLPTVISLVCTTIAIQNIGSTLTAILGALEPLTAVLIGCTVFGEDMTLRVAAGLGCIIVAVTLVIAGDNISAVLLRMRRLFPSIYRRLHHK